MDKRIGAQYFTVRKFTQNIGDFDTLCKAVSEVGYKTVQISGTPLDPKEMKIILDKYGLECVITHRPYDDFVNNIEAVIEYNKALGCKLCGLGGMDDENFVNLEKLNAFIENANKACKRLKEEGMYFCCHNHSREFLKLEGKWVWDRLVEGTDPETFNFTVDTYWVQHGGANPADVIEKLGKRAMAVHFKDFYIDFKEHKPIMADVGYGNLDWDKIIEACEKAGTKYALVERDDAGEYDPVLSLKNSYDFLTTKGFC